MIGGRQLELGFDLGGGGGGGVSKIAVDMHKKKYHGV